MQNDITSRQIDRYGYHSIENSQFSGTKYYLLASKDVHVRSYGGLKFLGFDLKITKNSNFVKLAR